MDAPLARWYCDVCGEPIETVKEGYVIWGSNAAGQDQGFKIIHQGRCDDKSHPSSGALDTFLGLDGQANLLSFLSYGALKQAMGTKMSQPGVADMDEFVDFFRRLQTPRYEEARRHFKDPDVMDGYADANQVLPYLPRSLLDIVKRSEGES